MGIFTIQVIKYLMKFLNYYLNKIMIIHVDGVQGSGKSYICSKLKNVLCVDTDDIMKNAIDIIEKSQKTIKKMPRTFKQLQKVKKQIVNKIIKENVNKKIVFVGMTVDVPNPEHKLFIKINDFTTVYKRLLLRELSKIVKHEKEIINHINKEKNPEEIDIQRIADMSLIFPVDYNAFKGDYNERLKETKKIGYIPKTQDEIIDFINKL